MIKGKHSNPAMLNASTTVAHLEPIANPVINEQNEQIGALNGLTILRFIHSMELTGGVGNHILELDQKLLERNNTTIIQMFYTKQEHIHRQELHIGQGRLIQIPIYHSLISGKSYRTKNLIIKNLTKKAGLKGIVTFLLKSEKSFLFFRKFPFVKDFYYSSPYPFVQLWRPLRSALDEFPVDLIINHAPFLLDQGNFIHNEGLRRNIPVAMENHNENKKLETNISLHSLSNIYENIAVVSSLDVPNRLVNKTTVLGNGIDADFFSEDKVLLTEVKHLKQELNIEDAERVIFFPARVCYDKGVIDSIYIANSLKRKSLRFKMFLVGTQEEVQEHMEEFHQMIIQFDLANNVFFTGHLDKEKLRIMYRLSDVVLLSSYTESVPRVLLEAQTMGKPVVAYNNSGIREALLNGKTGYLVEDRNVDEFASRLEELLSDQQKREEMGRKGKQFILPEFTLPTLAERHEQYYLKVLHPLLLSTPTLRGKVFRHISNALTRRMTRIYFATLHDPSQYLAPGVNTAKNVAV